MNTKHIRHIIRTFLVTAAVMLQLFACNGNLPGPTGSLAISAINGASRSLAPQDCTVVSYHATGTGPLEMTLDQTQATPTFTFDSLAVGTWTIQIDGLDAEGNVLLSGLATVEVVSQQTTTESIDLVPAAGNGTLELAVSWPADKSVAGITASLVSAADSQISQSPEFTINQSTALCTSSTVASGFWILTITLDCGPGTSPVTIAEGVQVYNGKVTSGIFQLAAEDFYQGYTVTYMDTGSEGGAAPIDTNLYPLDGTATARTKGTLGSLAKTGYILSGWNTQADGSGTDYASGNPIAVTGNLVLYPVWLDKTVLAINGNGIVTDCNASFAGRLILPEGVNSINTDAFNGCSSLASICLPESVSSIGGYAFTGCSSLANISMPAGLTSIAWAAFSGCSSLASISLPAGLTSIGWTAFYGCSSLASISIPAGVTSIGDSVFSGCSSLASISLPAGLTSIGATAFEGCSSLESISLPAGLTSIGAGAFKSCSRLSNISLPAGISSIGDSTFEACSSLESMGLPAGLTSIGTGAFRSCSRLSSISLPAGVTTIGGYAFYGCSSLASISLPVVITRIGNYAFDQCTSLVEMLIDSVTPPSLNFGFSIFGFGNQVVRIKVPAGSVDAYKTATGWSDYASRIVAFSGTGGLTVLVPGEISISLTPLASLAQGQNAVVTATASDTVDTWKWYLDGVVQPGAAGSVFTGGSDLALGPHTLMVAVAKNGFWYSQQLVFNVE